MTDRTCCGNALIDTGYIGGELYNEHGVSGQHDWRYDGLTCCREGAQRWHQTCLCKAGRWTEPTAGEQADRIIAEIELQTGHPLRLIDAALLVVKEITPEEMDRVAGTVEQIRETAFRVRHMPPLNDPDPS